MYVSGVVIGVDQARHVASPRRRRRRRPRTPAPAWGRLVVAPTMETVCLVVRLDVEERAGVVREPVRALDDRLAGRRDGGACAWARRPRPTPRRSCRPHAARRAPRPPPRGARRPRSSRRSRKPSARSAARSAALVSTTMQHPAVLLDLLVLREVVALARAPRRPSRRRRTPARARCPPPAARRRRPPEPRRRARARPAAHIAQFQPSPPLPCHYAMRRVNAFRKHHEDWGNRQRRRARIEHSTSRARTPAGPSASCQLRTTGCGAQREGERLAVACPCAARRWRRWPA